MYLSFIYGAFLCFCVACSAKYIVPPSLVEPLKPKGLRVSIPDEEGITLMAFHGNINVPFEALEAGEMAKDIIRKRGNRWVFEDKNIRLKKGDVIYYWIYVILDGLGYQGLDRNHTVTDFVSIEEPFNVLTNTPTCQNSVTKVKGITACAQKLLFEASFKGGSIDSNVWFQEQKIGGADLDDEFVVFSSDNTNIVGNKLEIKPSLMSEKYSEAFIRNGELVIEDCTSNEEEYCKKRAATYLIMPPVLSSRVSTKNSFSFQYGVVEIKAKLPQGDWLVPELWLEPKEMGSAGRIVISLVRGNTELSADGNDISAKTMTAGAVFDSNRAQMLRKENSIPWNQEFHIFKVIWTKNRLTFLVDDTEIGRINSPDPNQELVPYSEYYVTLGVHAGGLRDFPDSAQKPWRNTDPKRVLKFWINKEDWLKSWNVNSNLLVEYVKVWSI